MIVYDDLEPSEKIKVYDKGIMLNGNGNGHGNGNGNGHGNGDKKYQMMVSYRTGDMWAPKLDMREALGVELREFVSCVERGHAPVADGHAGLRVVRILEAATTSLAERGRVIELEPAGCTV
jgi:predicted dehydrogenase